MKIVNNVMQNYYKYDGKFYKASDRKTFKLNDIFLDGRDYCFKVIENDRDLTSVAFIDPELYVILEEVTIRN